jgi:hypothetical protein
MEDEPTTPPPPPSRRRPALILLAIGVCALVVLVSVLWATRPTSNKKQAAPEPTPVPSTSSTPTPTPTPSTSTPKPPPPKPKVPHDYVAAAAPTSFSFAGKGFTIKATVCGMEFIRPLDPPGEQHHTVCWVQHDFGYAPGSKGQGTTYVLGHAWGQDPQEVLNKISETVTRDVLPEYSSGAPRTLGGVPIYPSKKLDGYVLSLRTATGLLRYKVTSVYAVAKEQAGNVAQIMNTDIKNRVVLITCSELNHVDYDYNIVVNAYLMSSKAINSTT